MIIHFVCRGNAFRRVIAEAYLNSLEINGWSALSSGTSAAAGDHGEQLTQGFLESADITICMNQRVYDEWRQRATFPMRPRIWSVADIGEPGRIPATEPERERYREEAYQEIVGDVDQLVSDIARAGAATAVPDRSAL